MFCHECGAEIPDDADYCSKCGTRLAFSKNYAVNSTMYGSFCEGESSIDTKRHEQEPAQLRGSRVASVEPGRKRPKNGFVDFLKLIGSAFVVFLVLILIIGLATSGKDKGEPAKTNEMQPLAESPKNTVNKPTEQPDKKDSGKTMTVKEEESNRYSVGDIIENNGLRISYISADKYVEPNIYLQPSPGNMYYKFSFTIENISNSDKSINSFDCYADDVKAQSVLIGDDSTSLLLVTLSPGRKVTGSVYYEIPKNSSRIELEYEIDYWTDKKIVFVGKE